MATRPRATRAAAIKPGESPLAWGESGYGPGEMPRARTVPLPSPAPFGSPSQVYHPTVPTGGGPVANKMSMGNQGLSANARPLPMPPDRPQDVIWSIGDMIPGSGDIRQILAALLGLGRR